MSRCMFVYVSPVTDSSLRLTSNFPIHRHHPQKRQLIHPALLEWHRLRQRAGKGGTGREKREKDRKPSHCCQGAHRQSLRYGNANSLIQIPFFYGCLGSWSAHWTWHSHGYVLALVLDGLVTGTYSLSVYMCVRVCVCVCVCVVCVCVRER